jgi:hypothetical protein
VSPDPATCGLATGTAARPPARCMAGQAGAWLERQEGVARRRGASRGLARDDGAARSSGATEGNPRPAPRWTSASVPKRPGLLRPIPKTSMRCSLAGIFGTVKQTRNQPDDASKSGSTLVPDFERTNCHAFQCAYCRYSGCGRNRDVGSTISYIHIHRDQARRTGSDFGVRVRYQPDARSQRHSVGLMSRCTST